VTTAVSVIGAQGHQTTTVDLSKTQTLNLQIVPLQAYDIEPSLYTQEPGGSAELQPNTWRSEVHFNEYIQTPEQDYYDPSEETSVEAYPGDQVSLCGDGSEVGLNAGCTSVTLPADNSSPIPIALTLAGAQQVTVTATRGDGVSGTVQVSGVEQGNTNTTFSVSIPTGTDDSGDPQTVAIPDAGIWDLTFTDGTFGRGRRELRRRAR
jgi:hypothetical protein